MLAAFASASGSEMCRTCNFARREVALGYGRIGYQVLLHNLIVWIATRKESVRTEVVMRRGEQVTLYERATVT